MRPILLLALPAALLTTATPAIARDRAAPSIDRVGRALSDPQVQAGVAAVVGAFADAVLDTRVGPLAHYLPDHAVGPDDTLGDVVRRGDPDFDRRLHDGTRGAVALAGRTAQDAATMQQELGRTADRLSLLFAATAGVVDAIGSTAGADTPDGGSARR